MDTLNKKKQLFTILFGAAWIDGTIQKEERAYLQGLAQTQGLSDEPDIKALLTEVRPIQPTECYQCLENYLGDNPTLEDYQNLLDAISTLIYKDGDVQTPEAQLLTKLQLLDPGGEPRKSAFDKVLATIQKLYRQAIAQNP